MTTLWSFPKIRVFVSSTPSPHPPSALPVYLGQTPRPSLGSMWRCVVPWSGRQPKRTSRDRSFPFLAPSCLSVRHTPVRTRCTHVSRRQEIRFCTTDRRVTDLSPIRSLPTVESLHDPNIPSCLIVKSRGVPSPSLYRPSWCVMRTSRSVKGVDPRTTSTKTFGGL